MRWITLSKTHWCAVAVHPDDDRYRHLVGRQIELPLTGRRIPVVADEHVDPSFGTGTVKVTPAHDPNDFEIGQRHGLPSLTVMDERGVISVHGPFESLDRFEARPAAADGNTNLHDDDCEGRGESGGHTAVWADSRLQGNLRNAAKTQIPAICLIQLVSAGIIAF
jgi:hypothetical protein